MTDRLVGGRHPVLVLKDWDQYLDAGEWSLGEGGLPFRAAARVLAMTQDGEVLLLVGHDVADPDHSWTPTPGGELHSDEDLHAGAVYRLVEESGIEVLPEDLGGPITHRETIFRPVSVTCCQDEIFFLLHLLTRRPIRRGGWTCLEHDIIDSVSWWNVEQLQATQQRGQEIYLVYLPEVVEELASGWNGRYLDPTDLVDHKALTELASTLPRYCDPNT